MANIFAIYGDITANTVDVSVGNATNKRLVGVAAGTSANNALAYGQAGANVADLTVASANAATTGTIKLAHGATIYGRDNANFANVELLNWGATADQLTFPNGLRAGSGTFSASGTIKLGDDGWITSGTMYLAFTTATNKCTIVASGGIVLNNAVNSNSSITAAGNLVSTTGGYSASLNGTSSGYLTWTAITGQTRSIYITTNPTATATGALFSIQGQDCSGTTSATGGNLFSRAGDATGGSGTRVGGNWIARAGTGATTNGYLELQ